MVFGTTASNTMTLASLPLPLLRDATRVRPGMCGVWLAVAASAGYPLPRRARRRVRRLWLQAARTPATGFAVDHAREVR